MTSAADASVEVEGLSKAYEVGDRSRFEPVTPLLSRLRRRTGLGTLDSADDEDDDELDPEEEEFEATEEQRRKQVWALQDVSFEIPTGSVFGILGGAGAGKTTLLNLLGGVVRPTSGRIVCYGTSNPLPEAARLFMRADRTPRENVLSMIRLAGRHGAFSRDDADEIVRFVVGSDRQPPVTKLLLRQLSLATALFLEPDVLLLDELYGATGDFRDRCLRRIDECRGRTTAVLASRDAALLDRLCTDGILLDSGTLVERGSIHRLVGVRDERLHSGDAPPVHGFSSLGAIVHTVVENADGMHRRRFRWDEDIVLRIGLEVPGIGEAIRCGVRVRAGRRMALSARQPEPYISRTPGLVSVHVRIPAQTLEPDSYSLDVDASISDGGVPAAIAREAAATFEVGYLPDIDQLEGAEPDPPEEELELAERPIGTEVEWTVEADEEPA